MHQAIEYLQDLTRGEQVRFGMGGERIKCQAVFYGMFVIHSNIL